MVRLGPDARPNLPPPRGTLRGHSGRTWPRGGAHRGGLMRRTKAPPQPWSPCNPGATGLGDPTLLHRVPASPELPYSLGHRFMCYFSAKTSLTQRTSSTRTPMRELKVPGRTAGEPRAVALNPPARAGTAGRSSPPPNRRREPVVGSRRRERSQPSSHRPVRGGGARRHGPATSQAYGASVPASPAGPRRTQCPCGCRRTGPAMETITFLCGGGRPPGGGRPRAPVILGAEPHPVTLARCCWSEVHHCRPAIT